MSNPLSHVSPKSKDELRNGSKMNQGWWKSVDEWALGKRKGKEGNLIRSLSPGYSICSWMGRYFSGYSQFQCKSDQAKWLCYSGRK